MGEKNDVFCAWLEKAEIFSDFMNGAMKYTSQLRRIRERHRRNKDLKGSAQFLSGITGSIWSLLRICRRSSLRRGCAR